MIDKPTPEQVKQAREAACLTQYQAAQRFGYTLNGWQKKEQTGAANRSLSTGEYEFLLLLANQHPHLKLCSKHDEKWKVK